MPEDKIIIYQKYGKVIVEIQGSKVECVDCNPMKLARTMWNKDGDKYTPDEMAKWGFYKKALTYGLN